MITHDAVKERGKLLEMIRTSLIENGMGASLSLCQSQRLKIEKAQLCSFIKDVSRGRKKSYKAKKRERG